jgi:UDP-glucose 4-epimerase
VAGESSYLERAPTPALAALASSVWIQQVGDRPLAQRHMPHGGAEVRCAYAGVDEIPWSEDAPLSPTAAHQIPVFKKTAELFTTLTGDNAGFDAVNLRIGTIWGPLGLPDNPFTPLPRLLSAAVWGEDPDLNPPRPPAYAEDATDLCYVKDCGRAIALLMLADRLDHGTYNVSSGRLVR